MTATTTANAALIWAIAELLRGDYKQSDYGKVILPFTLLRRLDCVLAPTKAAVLAAHEQHRFVLDIEEQREVTHQRGSPNPCASRAP